MGTRLFASLLAAAVTGALREAEAEAEVEVAAEAAVIIRRCTEAAGRSIAMS